MGRRLALLIATYDYEDTGLRRLTAPAHDAEAFAAVLKDPDIAGFEVTTLINEPHHQVGAAIGDLYRDRRRDDLTLLYFTGHGLKDEDGRLYLATANTRRDSLLFTSLPAEQVDQAMSGCMSRQKVLILDCCYSGAFPAGRIAKGDTNVHALERFQGRGRTVLTASDATQYSFEGSQPRGEATQSVFTRYLVAGLRDGSADLDGDGNITLDELYSYVHDRVIDEMPQQRPKKQDNVEGRIVIARNINWTLPAYLSNALRSPIATDRLAALDGLAHLHRIGNNLVRQRINGEIQRLVDDDSRLVSAAAAAQIESIQPPGTPGNLVASHVPETPQPAVGPSPKITESPPEKALEPPLIPTPAPPIPHAAMEATDRKHHSSPQQAFPSPPTVPPRGPRPGPPAAVHPSVFPGPDPIPLTSLQLTLARLPFLVALIGFGLSLALPFYMDEFAFGGNGTWPIVVTALASAVSCTVTLLLAHKAGTTDFRWARIFHAVATVPATGLFVFFFYVQMGSLGDISLGGWAFGLACAAQIYGTFGSLGLSPDERRALLHW
ncbi:caspase family protein [Streptomyces canus]|uniref:caspase family protein n=1 Tax=Streptomyces canus TaxID=58343 RepID=UPI00224ECCDB|nr:caspase family protein [Streptomyces canus]MCX5262252.1 caspase family protein [Streptomyces canus]